MTFGAKAFPRGKPDGPPPVDGWDTFGCVFSNQAAPTDIDASDVHFRLSENVNWSANQSFTNANGDTARVGWTVDQPTAEGFFVTPSRAGGFHESLVANEAGSERFRIGIAAANQGDDFDVVASLRVQHGAQSNFYAQAYVDGTTAAGGFGPLTWSGVGPWHLDGTEYTYSNWVAVDVPGFAGRIRCSNVQEFVEVRFYQDPAGGSKVRWASMRLYRVTA